MRLFAFSLRDVTAIGKLGQSIGIPVGLIRRGLCLRQRGLCRRQLPLRLADLALGVELRLIYSETALFQLGFQDRNLLSRSQELGFTLIDRRLSLLDAGPQLRIIESGDHLAGGDFVAFTHSDLLNSSGHLYSYRRVVALDSTAKRNEVLRNRRLAQKEPPAKRSCNQED